MSRALGGPRISTTMQGVVKICTFVFNHHCPIFIKSCIIESLGKKTSEIKSKAFPSLKKHQNCVITDLEIQAWNNKRLDALFITERSEQLVIPPLAVLQLHWLILPIAFLINCWKAAYSAQFNFSTRPFKASHQASCNDTSSTHNHHPPPSMVNTS